MYMSVDHTCTACGSLASSLGSQKKGGRKREMRAWSPLYFTNAPIYHAMTRCGIYDDIINIDQLSGAGNALFY